MAKFNNKAKMLLNLVLMLSLLLIINMAESTFLGIGFGKPTPVCESVFGARAGDTCFSITQLFNLTADFFNGINPNLNCSDIFVGEWLCVEGSAN